MKGAWKKKIIEERLDNKITSLYKEYYNLHQRINSLNEYYTLLNDIPEDLSKIFNNYDTEWGRVKTKLSKIIKINDRAE